MKVYCFNSMADCVSMHSQIVPFAHEKAGLLGFETCQDENGKLFIRHGGMPYYWDDPQEKDGKFFFSDFSIIYNHGLKEIQNKMIEIGIPFWNDNIIIQGGIVL